MSDGQTIYDSNTTLALCASRGNKITSFLLSVCLSALLRLQFLFDFDVMLRKG